MKTIQPEYQTSGSYVIGAGLNENYVTPIPKGNRKSFIATQWSLLVAFETRLF